MVHFIRFSRQGNGLCLIVPQTLVRALKLRRRQMVALSVKGRRIQLDLVDENKLLTDIERRAAESQQ